MRLATKESRLLPKEDHDTSQRIAQALGEQGLEVLTGRSLESVTRSSGGFVATMSGADELTLEVEGVLDDIEVDYDWQPSPCQRCSSFGHEPGSCISVCETVATMGETSNQSLASESSVTEKVVEASSPPTDPTMLGPEHVRTECTIIPETSSGKHKAQAVDMLARELANKEPVIADKTPIALFEERQVTRVPGAKPKFRSTPHAKKSISTSPPKAFK